MALNATQLSWIRSKVGSTPDDAALNTLYTQFGNIQDVARQVLSQRLADMASTPATFNVEGAYSQSTNENLKTLREQLADPDLYTDEEEQPGEVVIVPPRRRRSR